jgi:CopG family transcriptional regulator, nickel-responsive regulator
MEYHSANAFRGQRTMERFTISLSDELAGQFDELLRKKGYENRSEAVRDMLRNELAAASIERNEAPYCVAALSYVYNHHARDLAERLTELQHAQHDIVLSSMHVHLDHDNCMETLILRGPTSQVSKFANTLMAEAEVRHGRLNLVPVDMDHEHGHGHGHGSVFQYHVHSRPRT